MAVCSFFLLHMSSVSSPSQSGDPLRYDLGITNVMLWAMGCLTRKNILRCLAFLAQCRAVFVDLFHFLLLFVTFLLFVSFVSYFLLLKGVRFVNFCYFFTACNFCKLFFIVQASLFVTFYYFFTACNFHKLFFIVEKGQGNCFIIFTSGYPLIVSTN